MKVFIGIPTYEGKSYCLPYFLDGLRQIKDKYEGVIMDNSADDGYYKQLKELTKDIPQISVLKERHIKSSMDNLVNSRNALREIFLKGDYDYFFSLEQDVACPETVISDLLRNKKDVCAGIYYSVYGLKGEKQVKPVLFDFGDDPKTMKFMGKTFIPNQLLRARVSGMGCIIISREVIEKIRFRHDNYQTYDDVCFANDLLELDMPIYADTNVQCRHYLKIGDAVMMLALNKEKKEVAPEIIK